MRHMACLVWRILRRNRLLLLSIPVVLFRVSLYIYIYIYVCVCVCVLFGPVKPELGVIPSGQENHSGAEHLNFPVGELNVTFYRAIFL